MSFFLVTGGAGFIGANLVEYLVKKGEKVRVLDNFSTGKKENLKEFLKKIDFIEGDIRDLKIVEKATKNIDYVLHHAALRSVERSVDNPLASNEVNVNGTINILSASLKNKVQKVIYASSSSAYGDNKKLPLKESFAPAPKSPYAVSKLTGEYYCKVFSEIYGLNTISLRYFNVFGPRQDPESKYSNVIPIFLKWAFANEPLQIHGTGKQARDFTYIDNVVFANMLSVKTKNTKGQVLNIGCGKMHSVLDIVSAIEKVLNKKLKKIFTKPRVGDVQYTKASLINAQKILKYKEQVAFFEGLKRTVKYFQDNPQRLLV